MWKKNKMYTTLNNVCEGLETTISYVPDEHKDRLERLNIREGNQIIKISNQFWKGAVSVQIGKSKITISYKIAENIIVEVR